MKISASSVLVIIPALNEEVGLRSSLKELKMVLDDANFLVIDGNSTDRTAKVAIEMGAEILFQKASGKGAAIAEAIKHVKPNSFKYIVFIDADYTYPAKFVPVMLQILENDPKVGMVTGNRFSSFLNSKVMKGPFYAGNRFLAFTQLLLNGVNLNDPLSGLRAVRWSVIHNWKPKSVGFDIEVELNHQVENMGYNIAEIPIKYRSRVGLKKLKLRHGITILRRIVSESFN